MNFDRAVKIVMQHEGGYVQDPNDPGGETKFGISKRTWPNVDIENLTKEKAAKIYKIHYWDAIKAYEFPPEIRLPLFDACVNQGQNTAIKLLQKVVGAKQDGYPGPMTIAKVRKYHRWRLVTHYQAERVMKYSRTNNFYLYGLGWMRRLQDITLQCGL